MRCPFFSDPPLPNALGRRTENYIRPFHRMPSVGDRPATEYYARSAVWSDSVFCF